MAEDQPKQPAIQKPTYPKNIERMFETFLQTPQGDFRPTFYNPFEVKHRRRTTKAQFKILERAFQENSKPPANLRRALAGKLGMTPRAVQVWFQNRRAKLKVQETKGVGLSRSGSSSDLSLRTTMDEHPQTDQASPALSYSETLNGEGEDPEKASSEPEQDCPVGSQSLTVPPPRPRSNSCPNIDLPFKPLQEALFGQYTAAAPLHFGHQSVAPATKCIAPDVLLPPIASKPRPRPRSNSVSSAGKQPVPQQQQQPQMYPPTIHHQHGVHSFPPAAYPSYGMQHHILHHHRYPLLDPILEDPGMAMSGLSLHPHHPANNPTDKYAFSSSGSGNPVEGSAVEFDYLLHSTFGGPMVTPLDQWLAPSAAPPSYYCQPPGINQSGTSDAFLMSFVDNEPFDE